MTVVITIFSALFALLALVVLFGYFRTGHLGLLLIAIAYGASAVLALVLVHWWPLTAGFALAWLMKMMGLEPEVREQSQGGKR
jgi:hypothetical protein